MTIEDYDAVMALWQDTPGLCLNDSDTREGIAAFLERNPGLSVVARVGGKLVGAVLCGHDGRRGYLHHMAVAENWRGDGIGSAMADACLAGLLRQGIRECKIFKLSTNSGAEQFWLKRGWLMRDNLHVMQRMIA